MTKTVAAVYIYIYIYIWINLMNELNRKAANVWATLDKTYLSGKESRAWKKVRCLANHIRDG